MPLKAVFDGRALLGPRTGVGTWTLAVAGGLARRGRWTVELAAQAELEAPEELREAGVAVAAPARARVPGTLWLRWLLPRQLERAGAAVFVGSLALAPRRNPVPSVVVVHDLTPRTLPHRHTLVNRFVFNAYLESSLAEAAAVVAVSRATRDELVAVLPWVEERLAVIPNGVSDRYTPPGPGSDPQGPRSRHAAGRPYILHLGTLEPRKGIPDLVAAWEILVERDSATPDLVLAGGHGWGLREILPRIAASPHRDRIHLPGYVPDAEAVELLRHAELFVLPSEAEGFGLPLAEAICCGAPCVASDLPVLREVAGGAALHAPVHDPEGLAAVMAAALGGEGERLRRLALERAPRLRWGPAIDAWEQLLDRVAGAGPAG